MKVPNGLLIRLYTSQNAPASGPRAIISIEKLSELHGKGLVSKDHSQKQLGISPHSTSAESHRG